MKTSQTTADSEYPSFVFPFKLTQLVIRKRSHILRVIGQFVAKAMLDSRIIDLSLNKVLIKLILGEEVALTIDNLRVCVFSFVIIAVHTDLQHFSVLILISLLHC